MRLLLDEHVSDPRVGGPLRRAGHDVVSAALDPALRSLADDELLAYAAAERRVLVTFNIADFPVILREWAEAGRSHAGVVLVYGLRHHEHGAIVRRLIALLQRRSRPKEWVDVAVVIGAADR